MPAGKPTEAERARLDALDHQRELEQGRRMAEAGRDKLMAQFRAEQVDTRWALDKEQALTRLASNPQIEALQAVPQHFQVSCRSSVCRIDADFPSNAAADDWYILYVTGAGTAISSASFERSLNPDGGTHLEVHALGPAR